MMMNPVIVANQRKQTANMVSAIVGGVGGGGAAAASNTTTNKKPLRKKPSQRQARPIIMVHPGQYGEIANPNVNDVLSGRGGRINGHPGNVQYREMVNATKDRYLDPKTKKLEKAHIAAEIVYEIRSMNPPGRFLAEQVNGHWLEIGDARAFKKVGQALREDAPEIRATDGSEEILDSDLTNNTSPTTITSTTPSTKKKNSGVTKPPSKTATSSSTTNSSSTNSNKKQPSGSTSLDMTTNIVTTTTTTTTTPIMTNMQTPRTPSSSKKTTTTSTTTSKRGGRMGQYSPVSDSNPTSITNPYYLPTVTTPLPAFAQSNMIISGAAAQTLQDFEMPRAGGGGGGIIISTTMPKVATTTPITSTSTHAVPASDELFDRQFFPLPLSSSDCYGTNPIHNDRESSILSGVSCPSAMSGVSQISGLTDPMSMISETTTAAAAAPVIMTTTAPSSSSQPYHPRATPIIVPTVSQLQQFYYVPTEPSQQQHHPQPPPHVPIHNLEDDNMSWMTMMMIQMEATKHSSHPSTAVSSRPLPQRPPTLYPPYATSTTTIASTNASVTSMTLGDEMSQLSEQFNELYKDIEGCSLPSVNGGSNNGPSPKTLWEV